MIKRPNVARREVLAGGLATAALGTGGAFAQGKRLEHFKTLTGAGTNALLIEQLMLDLGYRSEFGIESETLPVSDGTKNLAGIVSGGATLSAFSGIGQVFPAVEKGAQIKIISGCQNPIIEAVFAKNPSIQTVRDLEGKTIGVGAIGALLHQFMVALLRKKGVDPAKVSFVNVGSSSNVVKAVVAGAVDAGPGEIDTYEHQDRFGIHALRDGALWTELPEYTFQAVFTSDAMIRNRRDILVRALAAYAKLFRFLESPGSKAAYLKARAKVLNTNDPDDGIAGWEFIQTYKSFVADLVLSEDRIRYLQTLNISMGIQSKMLPYEQVTDMSLARDALRLIGG